MEKNRGQNLNMVLYPHTSNYRVETSWKTGFNVILCLHASQQVYLCFCKTTEVILSVLFLAVLCSLLDLSSLTRD